MERQKTVKENDRLKSNSGSTSDDKICRSLVKCDQQGNTKSLLSSLLLPKGNPGLEDLAQTAEDFREVTHFKLFLIHKFWWLRRTFQLFISHQKAELLVVNVFKILSL
jgi:hypothetical protein